MGGRGSSFSNTSGVQRERYGRRGNDDWFERATVAQPTTNKDEFTPGGTLNLDEYKINVYKNTDPIADSLMKDSMKAVVEIQDNLKTHYNIDLESSLKDETLGFYAGQTKQSVIAAYSRDKIAFNKNYYGNEEKLTKVIADSVKSGHSAKCDKKNYNVYTVAHEYGHFVQDHIIKKRLEKQNLSYTWENQKDEAKKMRLEILEISKNEFNSKGNKISNYGLENSMEFFAEAFAESQLSQSKSPISKSLLVFLEKEGLE